MAVATGTSEQLGTGLAFARLEEWRAVEVTGGDAFDWLNDLVTADLAPLAAASGPGTTCPALRSLLLTPTGGVRATFTVAVIGTSLLLLQDPAEPRAIGDLLGPYVLSSDVTLTDRTGALTILARPGNPGSTSAEVGTLLEPSVLSPSGSAPGLDVLVPAGAADAAVAAFRETLAMVPAEEVEAWRVAAAIPRAGVDVLEADLPVEAGLDRAVAVAKGCYLGQEAVARTRNLGRPRRSLVAVSADGPVAPGESVLTDDEEVGAITSAASFAGSTVALARVRWAARDAPLRTAGGSALVPRTPGQA